MPVTRIAAIALGLACVVFGQTEPRKFEVASIKLSQPDPGSGNSSFSPNGAFNLNTNIRMIVQMAYNIRDYQLEGDPKWVNSDVYRITAKPPAGDPIPADQHERTEQESERLRWLLADRFQFSAHFVEKTMTEYALVVAKGGPKLKEIEHDASRFRLSLPTGKIATRGGAKIQLLVNLLEPKVDHPIVDETGLTGYYDIQLSWSPTDDPASGPSIFTALQEQLGLKLEPKKGPVKVLVIDHIERPSEN